MRAGAVERVHLEDEASAAIARCQHLEARLDELDKTVSEGERGRAQTIAALSADADTVTKQLEALQQEAAGKDSIDEQEATGSGAVRYASTGLLSFMQSMPLPHFS